MTNFKTSFKISVLGFIMCFQANFSVLLAQTSGPISPEVASFEPFDMSEIVNLTTGDFVYNIPLFEVPGPAGGFPISLSYHAGIMPTEEASWVGLGWTLNPGAINRTVNGYADDYYNAEGTTRQFWSGGTMTTKSYSINVQFPGIVGVNANLTVARDTYQGTSYGFGGGVSLGYNDGRVRLGVGVQAGKSPYGGSAYMSVGANAGIGLGNSASAGVGVNYSTANGLSASVGLNAGFASLGTNISSAGINNSFSFMGMSGSSNISNRNSGNISTSTESSGFTASVVVVSFSFRKETTRYWIDETDKVKINGVLHLNTIPVGVIVPDYFDNHDFDVYTALELDHKEAFELEPEPDATAGGTYPDYDSYQVLGQGIAGNIRPFIYQAHLNKRNKFTENDDNGRTDLVKQWQLGVNRNYRTHFRFINDFSNNMMNSDDDWQNNNFKPEYDFTELDERYGFRNYQLSGAKHVEHYTNSEIRDGINGFLEANATGFDRTEIEQIEQIGAFTVTNESGVTYHYSLPAYTRDEYQFSKKRDETKGLHYNHHEKREPYAYTWHLTAMTGPDYVDRGSAGLDSEDWGYWVEFEYGKWTEHFAWRNPGIGFNTDMDQEFDSYSEGQKEIYYLDAIRTKSHTAYFVKDIRKDAKSNTYLIKNRLYGMPKLYLNKYYEGGFEEHIPEKEPYCWGKDEDGRGVKGHLKQYKVRPMNSLRLAKIILVENDQNPYADPIDKSNGIEWKLYNGGYWDQDQGTVTDCDFSPLRINYHLYQNVLDVYDLERMEGDGLIGKSIKSIDFITDYSLAQGVPSSDKSFGKHGGKLTLRGLESFGIKGTSYMPPTLFDYEDKRPLPVNSHTYPFSDGSTSTGVKFKTDLADYDQSKVEEFVNQTKIGDIFNFNRGGKDVYAYIYEIGDDYFKSKKIGDEPLNSGIPTQMYITNNPPYNRHTVDQWGYYKSDFDFNRIGGNETLTKRPSEISAGAKDVWSLKKIKSNLGSEVKIEYESDEYENIAVANSALMRIDGIGISLQNLPNINLKLVDDGGDLGTLIGDVNTNVNISLTVRYRVHWFTQLRISCDCGTGFNSDKLAEMEREAKFIYKTYTVEDARVTAIDEDNHSILVEAPSLIQQLGSDEYDITWNNTEACNDELTCTYEKMDDGFYIVGGIVKAPVRGIKGGGIRTKSVTISTDSYSNKTNYSYSGGTTSFEPFGIVAPHYFEEFQEFVDHEEDTTHVNQANRAMKRAVMDGFHDMFLNSREILPPAVMYKTVTVDEEVIHHNGTSYPIPGKTEYEFEVYEKGLVNHYESERSEYLLPDNEDYVKLFLVKTHLKDYTARVGNPLRITHFGPDSEGNGLIKLDESKYHYLHDGLETFKENREQYEPKLQAYNNIGVTKELFTNARIAKVGMLYIWNVIPYAAKNHLFAVLGSKESFPSIKTGETHYNYKTGVSTSNYTRKFDLYTGIPTETISSDSYGNHYLLETDLAYKKYPEMGPIVENKATNKNMLSQVAGTKTWRINSPTDFDNLPLATINKQGLVSADVQTWAKNIETLDVVGTDNNRWRKKSNYNWTGDNRALTSDGLYPTSAFVEFNHNVESGNTGWEKGSEITLYDYYSHPLEAIDINGSYTATKMDSEYFRVIATATNASYNEFAFTSGEDSKVLVDNSETEYKLGGNILLRSSTITEGAPYFGHTGNNSIKVPDVEIGLEYEWEPQKNFAHEYKISLWIHKDSPDKVILRYNNTEADGGNNHERYDLVKDETKRSGDWYYAECIISANNKNRRYVHLLNDQTSNATTIIDDFRIQPLGSNMTTYVYDKYGRVSDVLDNNNLATHYEYNVVGQLISVHKETFQYGMVNTKQIEYNYTEK